jgi:hypothetical protein
MSILLEAASNSAPEWVVDDMPPGYRTRLAEIERLSVELRAMDEFARLLWDIGEPLERAVRDVFQGLKLEPEFLTTNDSQVIVRLDGGRRLLLHVTAAERTIEKSSPALEQVFHLVHKFAGEADRVVLVANVDRLRRPADRADALAPDALALLKRLGANFLPATHLFALWGVALQDVPRARTYVDRLHAQDGGPFPAPTI